MSRKKLVILMLWVFLGSINCIAQKAEFAFSVGGLSAPDRGASVACIAVVGVTCPSFSIETPMRVTYEGTFAGRVVGFKAAALYVEVPLLGTPTRESRLKLGSSVTRTKFSSFFLTPGLKLKLFPSAPISPFASLGVGFAHFTEGSGVGPVPASALDKTTGAGQFGGGVDIKTSIPFLAFRGEVRDYISGTPSAISVLLGGHSEPRLHNIFFGAGVVLRF